MSTIKLYTLVIGLLLCNISINKIEAQVTIGSKIKPNIGALLDIKEEDNTSKRGLLMPRVTLTEEQALYPMFWDQAANTPQNDYISNKSVIDKQHTGLMLYNVSEEDPFCSGMYMWSGEKWNRLSSNKCTHLKFTVTPTSLITFGSGLNGMAINPQSLTLAWSPEDAQISYTNVVVPAFPNLVTIDDTSFSPMLSTRPNNTPILFSPLPMTNDEIKHNAFRVKKSILTFQAEVEGKIEKQNITVSQINKTILVNDSPILYNRFYSTNTTDVARVQSNVKWKVSKITPANAAVSVSVLGTEYGEEIEDGRSDLPYQKISFQVNVGPAYAKYSYITFSDAQSPKRFNDIILPITQCNATNDLTMLQMKNQWENMYGVLDTDESDSNGDLSKNINKTQWHYVHPDTKSDIFFSSKFGNAGRWMTTNLATASYSDRTDGSSSSSLPTLNMSNGISKTSAYIMYPDGNIQNYIDRERVGFLYNWYAATGGIVSSVPDPEVYPQVQGICPKGWHLPSMLEWRELYDEIGKNYAQYSDYDIPNSNFPYYYPMKDQCEWQLKEGKSFDVLYGGFAYLNTGLFYTDGKFSYYNQNPMWWSSTNYNSNDARYVGFYSTSELFKNNPKEVGYAIRCKKDSE